MSSGPADEEAQQYKDWLTWLYEKTPIDLGDDNHRAGVAMAVMKADTEPVKVVWWLHTCTLPNGERKPMLGHCDVYSGTKHTLVSEDPLHLEPSILCGAPECRDHGWVRDGQWVAA